MIEHYYTCREGHVECAVRRGGECYASLMSRLQQALRDDDTAALTRMRRALPPGAMEELFSTLLDLLEEREQRRQA